MHRSFGFFVQFSLFQTINSLVCTSEQLSKQQKKKKKKTETIWMIRLSGEVYNEYMYSFDWFQNRYNHERIHTQREREQWLRIHKRKRTRTVWATEKIGRGNNKKRKKIVRFCFLQANERLCACLYCASVTSESVSVCWCVRIWRSLEAMLSNTPTEPILMQYNWAKHRDACVFVLPQPLRLLLLSSIPHCYYYCSLPFIGFHLFGIATHKTSTHCEQFARNFLSRLLRVFVRAT